MTKPAAGTSYSRPPLLRQVYLPTGVLEATVSKTWKEPRHILISARSIHVTPPTLKIDNDMCVCVIRSGYSLFMYA